MRRPLAAVLLALLVASPVAAGRSYPTDLTATLTVVSRTSSTVSVELAQTSGSPTTIRIRHVCYSGTVNLRQEIVDASAPTVLTFWTGPQVIHKVTYIPTRCRAQAEWTINGNTALSLADIETLP